MFFLFALTHPCVYGNTPGVWNLEMSKVVGEKKKIQWRVVAGHRVDYNPEMTWTRAALTADECEGRCVTPVQREIYILIDEWWKRFGFGPTYRELAQLRGCGGLGNTKRVVDRLVKLGVVKRVAGMDRSIRPTYIAFKKGEFE